jgi:hypothetical protein
LRFRGNADGMRCGGPRDFDPHKGKKAHYLVKIVLRPLRVVDAGLVAVMAEMAGGDQTVAP